MGTSKAIGAKYICLLMQLIPILGKIAEKQIQKKFFFLNSFFFQAEMGETNFIPG